MRETSPPHKDSDVKKKRRLVSVGGMSEDLHGAMIAAKKLQKETADLQTGMALSHTQRHAGEPVPDPSTLWVCYLPANNFNFFS